MTDAEKAGQDVTTATRNVVDGTPKALAGVFMGSLMVMVKAAKDCDDFGSKYCEDYEAWALACSVIGVAVSLVMIILLFAMPNFKKDCSIVQLVMVIFLACLWIAGAGTMTFKRPFKGTLGNGYFGAWIAVFSAVSLLMEALKGVCGDTMTAKLPKTEAWNWWFVLTAASVVATVQSAIDCDEATDCEDELAWALAASVISLVLCIVMIVVVCVCSDGVGADVWKWMSLGLVIWWMCGVGVSTYKKGPYVSAGNGYFSMWIALISAFQLFGLLFFTQNGAAEQAVEDAAKKAMEGLTGYITALFLFSLATLIAAAIVCDDLNTCKDYQAWAVAASAISVIITLFLLIATFAGFLPDNVSELVTIICSALLLCIWIAGTYTMTFKRPFKEERGNGYFGAWLSLIVAWWFATSVVPGLKEGVAKATQYGGWAYQVLAIGSLIGGVQAAHDCDDAKDCTDNHVAYAVAAGWISFVAVITVLILIACDCWNRTGAIVAAVFFTIWWLAGAFVLTYENNSPYTKLSNGYIGVWISTICSFLILADVWLRDGDGTEVKQPEVVADAVANAPDAPEAVEPEEKPDTMEEK
jgi:hypothetical protein